MAGIGLKLIGWKRHTSHASWLYNVLLWYWTSTLLSIGTCPNEVLRSHIADSSHIEVTCFFFLVKVARSNFQHSYFDGPLKPHFITWYYKHGIKKIPSHWWTSCYHFRDTVDYHSNSMTCKKTPFVTALWAYNSKTARWIFFYTINIW